MSHPLLFTCIISQEIIILNSRDIFHFPQLFEGIFPEVEEVILNWLERRIEMKFVIEPIAFVKNCRKEQVDDDWGDILSTIELAEQINAPAISGIHNFSHLVIIFYFGCVKG